MQYLTENQILALKFLATYKYLTSSQFVRMGLFKKPGYLTNALKVMMNQKRSLLTKHDYSPVYGKVESLYYLTKYGKQFLIDEFNYTEKMIKVPRGYKGMPLKDYFHRRYTIDFHIYLKKWLNENKGKVEFLNYYFDKVGNNRSQEKVQHVKALNRIELHNKDYFIPDIITIFTAEEQRQLYLFEQHNGKDSKRLFEQLSKHIHALAKGFILGNKHYQPMSHKVVVVCEFESVKKSVIEKLQRGNGIEHYCSFFLFKTNDELKQGFYDNWTLISGERATLI